MSDPNLRPCPVCGGRERRLIYRQSFMEGPMGDSYDVVVCAQCGAGFADGIPAQDEMDRYYSEQSKYSRAFAGGAESPWETRRFEVTARQAAEHVRCREASILDIGCATGGLLAAFTRLGFQDVTGVDPSPECAAAAKRLHGVSVRTATLAQLAGWDRRFDLILLVGVLEHVREAGRAVEIAAGLLKPGGLIYCAVPDVEGLAESVNAPFQQFSTEHVNFFSIHSMNRLFAAHAMASARAWRWTVEWREGVTEPVASGVYKAAPTGVLPFDTATGPALERYVAASAKADLKILSAIESLRLSQEPIIVWGAGTLARRLLATTRFAEANIQAFVDSDPQQQGGRLAGRPIVRWDAATTRNETVIICSVAFEKEIADTIRGNRGYSGRVMTIFGGDVP
jgi:SAM-dependent methyltransferase